MSHLLCIGFGYVATHVAGLLMDDAEINWRFSGTSRDQGKIDALGVQGVNMIGFDDPQLDFLVGDASHILISTAPDNKGCPAFRRMAKKIKPETHVVYLSATSVYGDAKGKWVDEETLATAPSPRGKKRLLAEKKWATKNAVILRLGAIYGPGRNVLTSLADGSVHRYAKKGQVFCRAHVGDIAHTITILIDDEIQGEIFNVVDDEPSSQSEVIKFAAGLLGQDPPEEEPLADAPTGVQAFYAENRRVKNTKLKNDLGLELAYPSYKEGLASLLD